MAPKGPLDAMGICLNKQKLIHKVLVPMITKCMHNPAI